MASAGSRLGGLETIAREFALGFAKLGHEVTLVTGTGPSARLLSEASEAPYRVVTAPTFGQTSLPARLIGKARGIHPSVVEAVLFWRSVMRTPRALRALEESQVISAHFEPEAVEASRIAKVPVVYYYAGPMDPARLARAHFMRVVAMSGMVARYHASLNVDGLPRIDGIVLPGVGEELISAGPSPQVGTDYPEAIFTGRLDNLQEKGVEALVRWWPEIREAMPKARLTIVGGGAELPRLRREIAERGLEAAITLSGPLPHGQLQERIRQASLYLFPSRFETFGVAPLEALAAGLPVIASDIPALRESLGDAALLISPDDDKVWKQTIIRLLHDPEERLRLAERGPKRASELTWAKQSAQYEAYLLDAAASGSVSSSGAVSAPRSAAKV